MLNTRHESTSDLSTCSHMVTLAMIRVANCDHNLLATVAFMAIPIAAVPCSLR